MTQHTSNSWKRTTSSTYSQTIRRNTGTNNKASKQERTCPTRYTSHNTLKEVASTLNAHKPHNREHDKKLHNLHDTTPIHPHEHTTPTLTNNEDSHNTAHTHHSYYIHSTQRNSHHDTLIFYDFFHTTIITHFCCVLFFHNISRLVFLFF